MKKNFNCFSSFILKIVAIISMTIDHIGVALSSYYPNLNILYTVFRYIGRLAMPLFAFMIVEGVLHTKNFKKYFLKLIILAAVISIGLAIAFYFPQLNMSEAAYAGNVFLDLSLGALMVYCLKNKNTGIKLCSIPIVALSILSFAAKCSETYTGINCGWYPPFLRFQYDWLSIIMILGFYFSYSIADAFWENQSQYSGISLDVVKVSNQYRLSVNIIDILIILVAQLFYYFFIYINPGFVFWDAKIQLCAIASAILLLFYNGKRGYNKKWFNIFSYLYYPLHILIIFAIFYLTTL